MIFVNLFKKTHKKGLFLEKIYNYSGIFEQTHDYNFYEVTNMNTKALTEKLGQIPLKYTIDNLEEIKLRRKREQERKNLTNLLTSVGKEIESERENFKEAVDSDLIDFYSYMILAKEAKYKFILKLIKEFDEQGA